VAKPLDLRSWLQDQCDDFRFEVGGVFQRESDIASWPLEAASPLELEQRLALGGHLLPLPSEPAALANILEVSVVSFLALRVLEIPGAKVHRGTERGYPDIEVEGHIFGGGFHAVDVKAARRAATGRRTQSRITLYTGNTYFKWPTLAGLRSGTGAFRTPEQFYDYWRKYPFRTSAQVQRQLQRLLTSAQDELAQLRASQDPPG
jgi:hypothetical protein